MHSPKDTQSLYEIKLHLRFAFLEPPAINWPSVVTCVALLIISHIFWGSVENLAAHKVCDLPVILVQSQVRDFVIKKNI